MSTFGKELRDMRSGLADRVDLVRRMLSRLGPGPLLVRGAVFGCAAAALAVAYAPLGVHGAASALVLVAALPALFPRSMATTIVLFIAVTGWVLSGGYAGALTVVRLILAAALLYLLHTSAALAAVLPYDAAVSPRVLLGWLARAAVVLAGTAVFAVAAAVAAQRTGGHTYLFATLLGLAAMAGLAALLSTARRLRR